MTIRSMIISHKQHSNNCQRPIVRQEGVRSDLTVSREITSLHLLGHLTGKRSHVLR